MPLSFTILPLTNCPDGLGTHTSWYFEELSYQRHPAASLQWGRAVQTGVRAAKERRAGSQSASPGVCPSPVQAGLRSSRLYLPGEMVRLGRPTRPSSTCVFQELGGRAGGTINNRGEDHNQSMVKVDHGGWGNGED